jgi:hypothetical protein
MRDELSGGWKYCSRGLCVLNNSRIHVGKYLSFYGKTVRRTYFEYTATSVGESLSWIIILNFENIQFAPKLNVGNHTPSP